MDQGCENIEDLPRGQILGISIFSDGFWYDKNNDNHRNDPWILGPFVYKIFDVYRLEKGITVKGALGQWQCPKDIHQQIISQQSVQQKINEWKQEYGDKLYFGEQPDQIPIAVTIHQPFAEAILRKEKKYENRKKRIFHLHSNKKLYPLPPTPEMTQCRFCPRDDEHSHPEYDNNNNNSNNNNSNNGDNGVGGDNDNQCTHWAHQPEEKKVNKRKIRGSKDIDNNKITYNTRKRKRNQTGDIQQSQPTVNVYII